MTRLTSARQDPRSIDRPAVQPFGDQLTLADAAREIGFPCPSCHGTQRVHVPGSAQTVLGQLVWDWEDCRTCEGLGSVGYDPADTSEFGF